MEGVVLNLQTHSWSAYLATLACEDSICPTINMIAYAPAALPTSYPRMKQAYMKWNGSMTIIISSNDTLLSYATFMGTQKGIEANKNIKIFDAKAGHHLRDILAVVDAKQYLRN